MSRITIPKGCWMRYRKQGRYVFARNTQPITWTNKAPPKGTPLYYVAWDYSQGPLMASRVVVEA